MTLNLTQYRFGQKYQIDGHGTPVTLECYYREGEDIRFGFVTFACDPRKTQFPFELSRLHPIPSPEGAAIQ
jgi:hypothetical protein